VFHPSFANTLRPQDQLANETNLFDPAIAFLPRQKLQC
jgi:hypothetical protein